MSVSQPSAAGPPRAHRKTILLWVVVGVMALAGGTVLWRVYPRGPDEIEPDVVPQSVDFTGTPWFRDVTAESGLDFRTRNGAEAGLLALIEIMGGGVALLDYDGDGLLDIFTSRPRWQISSSPTQ